MVRVWLTVLVLLVLSLPLVTAIDNIPAQLNSQGNQEKVDNIQAQIEALINQQQGAGSYVVDKALAESERKSLLEELKAYQDENFMYFDGAIKSYMADFRRKMIVAAIGVNALVAGVIFYLLNNKNKSISYQSVALARQRSEEERQYVIQQMTGMRDQLRIIEDRNKQLYDSYVVPMQRYFDEQQARWQREEQARRDWERANQANSQQDFQQGGQAGRGDIGGGNYGGFEGAPYADSQYQAGFSVEGGEYPGESYQGNEYYQGEQS